MRSALNPQWATWQQTTGAAPLAPSTVTSITVDSGATVSWVNPGGGPSATSYTVTPYIAGTPQATTNIAAPATSANITGLTNATAYTFTVHAHNAAGNSPESAQSGANTPLANLIFGDDFNGTILDPHWTVWNRDGDQSNSETQYHTPAMVTLDGSSHLQLNCINSSITAPGYSDSNPPTYAGSNVTRQYRAGAVSWTAFSFTYGKLQVNAQISNLGAAGYPGIWSLGANCELTTPLDPDNVGTCAWPAAGSEEIDFGVFDATTATLTEALYYPAGGPFTSNQAVTNASTTYHTYEYDWTASLVTWLVDSSSLITFSTYVPSTPQFLIMNNTVRGTPVFTQPVMSIDWVRCFHN